MAIKKQNKKLYYRAAPVLIVTVVLLALSVVLYHATATSYSSSDVAHGLLTPLSSVNGSDGKAGIRAQKQKTTQLKEFQTAGQSIDRTISSLR